MYLFLISLTLLSLLNSAMVSNPTATEDQVGFIGTIGGHEVELNGTIQEIYAQAKALYPDMQDIDVPTTFTTINEVTHEQNRNLIKKNALHPALCMQDTNYDWRSAKLEDVARAYNQLLHAQGTCGVCPGTCVNVSVFEDATVKLCSMNIHTISPTCSYLSSYVEFMMNECLYQENPAGGWLLSARMWDGDKYYVAVMKTER
ncbi:hypothetical protein GLAREA_03544 [Glarea lozoyensis ATCC 20868]|uniref:Uncharacterized protein n=1 Tax=Glarea lozoyensis (strain ATCC 20868 / MF5171) TaxID=1116229 RepID=S3CVY6_GLAL2|nr:uncharacterized protein GLAREA_03544 [Glarea lozoyensis ATCC 20868]EPE30577.1 hypothetical protein GLAREA_03544 [Glarea lozoyensis ATCC 20868]